MIKVRGQLNVQSEYRRLESWTFDQARTGHLGNPGKSPARFFLNLAPFWDNVESAENDNPALNLSVRHWGWHFRFLAKRQVPGHFKLVQVQRQFLQVLKCWYDCNLPEMWNWYCFYGIWESLWPLWPEAD